MAEHPASGALASSAPAAESNLEVLSRIGHMTRALHDSLRGLGLDKLIEKAASDIPDARDRLDYVARMSEQAAQKVLNATDEANPLQDGIDRSARELGGAWQASRAAAGATKGYLMDIMMAQDFQDLTGQVIGKVTTIAQNLEQQLVQMLVDFAPAEVKREFDNSLLNGPQINPTGSADVVANQGQVDDLLDSLGF